MRRTFRLLASVKPARYLEAGAPTGLTGLYTHASPRSTLLFLYSSTLDKLKAVPEHSVYRQSVEALTKHRMAIVESTIPPGYDEWAVKARRVLADELEQIKKRQALAVELEKAEKETAVAAETGSQADKDKALRVAAIRRILSELPHPPADSNIVLSTFQADDVAVRVERGGQNFFIRHLPAVTDQRDQEWDGEFLAADQGARTLKDTQAMKEVLEAALRKELSGEELAASPVMPALEPEPQLTADQISEIETRIGAGLIEEVVQVAEGELKLVDTMVQAKAWESLEEPPAENQWAYFERRP